MDKAQPVSTLDAAPGGALIQHEQLGEAGVVTHRVTTLDGVPHGEMSAFGPDGAQLMQARYDGGVLDGVLKVHDEQGDLVQEASFVKGVRQGITRVYTQGRLLAVQHFAAGVLHGETLSYAESGDLASRQTFFQGRLEGEASFMNEGALVRRARFRKGKLEGETTTYDRDGALVQRETYKENLLEGPLTRYWPNGQVMERILYRAGKPVEKPRRFDGKGVELREQPKATLMQRLEQLVRG